MKDSLSSLSRLYEQTVLAAALRQLQARNPMHPAVPKIVNRLADQRAPSPMHPADGIVTGAAILGSLLLLALGVLGLLPGGVR
jgi:hypothetical protein